MKYRMMKRWLAVYLLLLLCFLITAASPQDTSTASNDTWSVEDRAKLINKFVQISNKRTTKQGHRLVYFVDENFRKFRFHLPRLPSANSSDAVLNGGYYYPFYKQWIDESEIITIVPSLGKNLTYSGKVSAIQKNQTAAEEMERMRSFCPCETKKKTTKLLQSICIVNNRAGKQLYTEILQNNVNGGVKLLLKELDGNTHLDWLVNNTLTSEECSVVFFVHLTVRRFVEYQSNMKELCPGSCLPVPLISFPLPWMRLSETKRYDGELEVLCSLTIRQLRTLVLQQTSFIASSSSSSLSFPRSNKILQILTIIAQRRLEECLEPEHWATFPHIDSSSTSSRLLHSPFSKLSRRPVFGLILWIGSRSNYDLLQRQALILAGQIEKKTHLVVGWSATEDTYGCGAKSRCIPVTDDRQYKIYMPRTFIPDQTEGWACAQRRPLRALSHVLMLYDPTYILLADDDTFISKNILFGKTFIQYVKQQLSVENTFVSKLYYADMDITRYGFYYGGSGYLIGKTLLDRLNAFEIRGPPSLTGYWTGDERRTRELSILYEVMNMTQAHCPDKCLNLPNRANMEDIGIVAKSRMRLVDICKNLMSDENTCYHSDHALCRCMAHGVYADFAENVIGTTDEILPNALFFGMSFYGQYLCDPTFHLACHRRRPMLNDSSLPELIQ